MRRYLLTYTATFEVSAENIMQARAAAERVKAVGATVGRRYGAHDRRGTHYSVRRLSETKTWRASRGEGG